MSKIFFTGAGKMATAIAGGLVRSGLYKTCELAAYDVNTAAGEAFTKETGVGICALDEAVNSEAVLIAVKPQMIAQALEPLKGRISDKLIISIAAGVTISQIAELTGAETLCLRTNTLPFGNHDQLLLRLSDFHFNDDTTAP